MSKDQFDITKSDSQASEVKPVSAAKFDFKRYHDYEQATLAKCEDFWKSDSGILVYRRMRVADVFNGHCKNMKQSLEWQLGALQKSVDFKADVPNFLEPWYGIGTAASGFNLDYKWDGELAPSIKASLSSTREAADYPVVPIKETSIGRHTLKMVEYFLDQTNGALPMSYCDIQSPLNVAGNLVEINTFMMDMIMDPQAVMDLLQKIAGLIRDFSVIQKKIIGECLAKPGHGFASARNFEGFGMSDDNIVMVSDDIYANHVVPSFEWLGSQMGGPVLHSCGKFDNKIAEIKKIKNLKIVDAAFSKATDPDPNEPEFFGEGFANSGIILNARIVGDPELIIERVKRMYRPGLKLILVTYSETPEEQEWVYDHVKELVD